MKFDKPVVLPEDLPQVVSTFGCQEVSEVRHLGGIPNVTYEIVSGANRLAVRICNNGYTSEAHLECEVRALVHLHESGFDLAPQPKSGIDGQYIQKWSRYRVLVTEMIDGTPASECLIDEAICREVGSALGRLGRALSRFDHRLPQSESYWSRSRRLLNVLPQKVNELGWTIDLKPINAQWKRAQRELHNDHSAMKSVAIHTDIWPPNVICKDGHVVGLIDFDDLAFGPMVLDLAAVLTEFVFTQTLECDETLAYAVFDGLFSAGGVFGDRDRDLLMPGIEASCIAWLAANALHHVSFEDSLFLVRMLDRLRADDYRRELAQQLCSICEEARANNSRPSPILI